MNQNEIIAMAKEADMHIERLPDDYCKDVGLPIGSVSCCDGVGLDELQAFAALVAEKAAAKEREACAKVAESMAPEFGEKGWAARDRGDFTLSLGMLGVEFQLKECASAIRARGQKEGV